MTNLYMARADKTVVLNVRVSENQAKWLRKVAEAHHSGNLIEAVRQALTDSWILRRARDEYLDLREDTGFQFPRNDERSTRAIELFFGSLGMGLTLVWEESDHRRARRAEGGRSTRSG